MSESIIVGLVAGVCGIGLEATRQWMTRSQTREVKETDEVTQFRQELRDENTKLRQQRDEWQMKYFDERDARLKAEWQLEALEWVRTGDPHAFGRSVNLKETQPPAVPEELKSTEVKHGT